MEFVVTTTGDSGFPIETWTVLANPYWCARSDVRGDESLEGGQVSAQVQTLWSGAYRPDMDPELLDVAKRLRLRYQGRIYDILSGFIVGARVGLEFVTLSRL